MTCIAPLPFLSLSKPLRTPRYQNITEKNVLLIFKKYYKTYSIAKHPYLKAFPS